MESAALVDALRPMLADLVVATDFDGVIAPLVRHPEDSRPQPGSIEALRDLAAACRQVAVVTGRDARTVMRLGDLDSVPGLVVEGLYGIETWRDGQLTTPDEPDSIRCLREVLPQRLRDAGADPEVWVEDKRLSLVIHARRTDDPVTALAAIEAAVRELADELELELHPGSGVLELRLPGYDKGGALERLVDEHAPAGLLYLGDDLGDVPAFAAVGRLRTGGLAAYSVGVLSSGVDEVAAACDVQVADPAAVVELLRRLLA